MVGLNTKIMQVEEMWGKICGKFRWEGEAVGIKGVGKVSFFANIAVKSRENC